MVLDKTENLEKLI